MVRQDEETGAVLRNKRRNQPQPQEEEGVRTTGAEGALGCHQEARSLPHTPEAPEEAYRRRLEEVFQRHGGLPEDPSPDSPYQQQLKMAYLQGLRSEISQFVRNHDVNYTTDRMNQIMNYELNGKQHSAP